MMSGPRSSFTSPQRLESYFERFSSPFPLSPDLVPPHLSPPLSLSRRPRASNRNNSPVTPPSVFLFPQRPPPWGAFHYRYPPGLIVFYFLFLFKMPRDISLCSPYLIKEHLFPLSSPIPPILHFFWLVFCLRIESFPPPEIIPEGAPKLCLVIHAICALARC